MTEGLVLDVMGPERGGKSDFACSVSLHDRSGPTHYLALDYNYRGPVNRYKKLGAKITVYPFFYSLPFAPPTSPKEKDFQNKIQKVADSVRPSYNKFKETLWKVLDPKTPGPVIIDNFTTLHHTCRLACFGYVHKVPMFLYAKRTNEMTTILNQIRYSGKNVVLIHRWSEIWDSNDKPTGEFERAGAFKPVAYEVMATLVARRSEKTGKFLVRIEDSTFNDSTQGMRFIGKERTFANVASALLGE